MANLQLVPSAIEAYAARHSTPLPALMAQLQAATEEARGVHARMVSGQVEGALLQILAQSVGARRILEFGTFTGFSALMIAAVLPDDGELITCEMDPDNAAFAQSWFDRAPFGARIHIRLGPALETLRTLAGPFDLVFVDAANEEYIAYYEGALPLLSPNGLIVVDNVLHRGGVLDPDDTGAAATDAFNKHVQDDPRVTNVLLTVRDGVMLVRKAGGYPRQ